MNQKTLKECLHYCHETGLFTWRHRPISHFKDARAMKSWNTRHAGELTAGLRPDGYIGVRLFNRPYLIHRLAFLYMTGTMPSEFVDHINGDRNDNRWSNIREATRLQNQQNMKMPTSNISGVVGVRWYKAYGRWEADIKASGVKYKLGYFDDFFEAICVRKSAERAHGFHINHGRI